MLQKQTDSEKEIRFVDTRCKGWGKRELDEFSQKVQSSSYKISKYWDVMCNMTTVANTAV